MRRILFLAGVGWLASMTCIRAITPNATEVQIANLAINHASQGRSTMVYSPILNLVARAKALDLARRAYFSHVDPDGYGPNRAAQLAGYRLPDGWGSANDTNYIESIGAGYANASAAFQAWLNSAGHRRHVLAETAFYREQTRYGIGYAEIPGSPYTKYYVFISAPPDPAGDRALEPYAEWLFGHHVPARIDREGDAGDANGNGVPRIVEFLLGFDPAQRTSLPAPVIHSASGTLRWTLPIRSDRGSVSFEVQTSGTLANGSWTTSGVTVTGGTTFSIPLAERGFLRLTASRP